MLKQLYELAKQLLSLTRDTEDNKSQIREVQQQIKTLTAVAQRLEYELRQLREHDAHEREKMALQLENAMLRFERRLMSGDREAP